MAWLSAACEAFLQCKKLPEQNSKQPNNKLFACGKR